MSHSLSHSPHHSCCALIYWQQNLPVARNGVMNLVHNMLCWFMCVCIHMWLAGAQKCIFNECIWHNMHDHYIQYDHKYEHGDGMAHSYSSDLCEASSDERQKRIIQIGKYGCHTSFVVRRQNAVAIFGCAVSLPHKDHTWLVWWTALMILSVWFVGNGLKYVRYYSLQRKIVHSESLHIVNEYISD